MPPKKLDNRLIDEAKSVLESGSCKVYKTTRAGFTTSFVVAARRAEKKILVIEPTHKIMDGTVMPDVKIPGNAQCIVNRTEVYQYPILKDLPLPLPSTCPTCRNKKKCEVLRILHVKDPKVVSMSYAKLEALMLSGSDMAERIRSKLKNVDIVLLDECHTIVLQSLPKVSAFTAIDVPKEFRALCRIYKNFKQKCAENMDIILRLKETGDTSYIDKHLSEEVLIKKSIDWKSISAASNELIDLAKKADEYPISREEILTLRDIISIMGSKRITFSYIREGDGAEGSIYLSGDTSLLKNALNTFLTQMVPRASHIYTSATLIEPYSGFFNQLSGKTVKDVIFPDLRKTDEKMTIIPDTWRLSARNFEENLSRIVEQITGILKVEGDAYILAPNSRKAYRIQEKLKEKLGDKTPSIGYYRSDLTMGVECKDRVCIAIGRAEIPSNTYDPLAIGRNSEEKWIHSQILRASSVQAATWQAWSRVKDPDGKIESKVYCIGIRGRHNSGKFVTDPLGEVVTWGPGRRLVFDGMQEKSIPEIKGRSSQEGRRATKTPQFHIEVDKHLPAPKIQAEERASFRKGRNTIDTWIDRIIDNSEIWDLRKLDKLPIIYNRQNVQKMVIFNGPAGKNQHAQTCLSLYEFFACRTDVYARQSKNPNKRGAFPYTKISESFDEDTSIFDLHLKGETTIGMYSTSPDNTCIWGCHDVDNHNGTTDSVGDAKKLIAVLDKYSIPFLLEASGSAESFHIWVLFDRARSCDIYQFMLQVGKEAQVKCEVFPKQESITKDGLGNLVKVPLGINRKNGKRSQFLDPETFEPLEGPIVPRLLRIREIPEHSMKSSSKSKERTYAATSKLQTILNDFKPCLKHLLDERTALEGGEGHEVRIAIAIEAICIGMTIEEIIGLYQHQPDFDHDITTEKVKDIGSRRYKPYRCETLREKCPTLIGPQCMTCLYCSHEIGTGEEAVA